MNIDKIHKIHAQNIQGVFFEKKNACGRLIDHGVLGGTLKSMNIDNIHKIHAQANPPKCVQQAHRPRDAWRDPNIDEHWQNHLCRFNT